MMFSFFRSMVDRGPNPSAFAAAGGLRCLGSNYMDRFDAEKGPV
jgi:hypothetical protein